MFLWDDHFGRSDALTEERQGGQLRRLYADFTKLAHELQPDCLILGRDVEHVGPSEHRESSRHLLSTTTVVYNHRIYLRRLDVARLPYAPTARKDHAVLL